jgi:hypothetical protein
MLLGGSQANPFGFPPDTSPNFPYRLAADPLLPCALWRSIGYESSNYHLYTQSGKMAGWSWKPPDRIPRTTRQPTFPVSTSSYASARIFSNSQDLGVIYSYIQHNILP